MENARRRLRLDVDVVVHGFAEPLLAAEIAFGCLHGDDSAVALVAHEQSAVAFPAIALKMNY